MRIDLRFDSAGFTPEHLLAEVYLNGLRLRDVILADDETGEIIRYIRNSAGVQQFDTVDGIASFATDSLTGHVLIVPRPPPPTRQV